MIASLSSCLAAIVAFLLAGTPPAETARAAPAAGGDDGAVVRVTVDTIVLDRRGTVVAASDEADLIPGTPGVLRKTLTLIAKDARRTREQLDLEVRITPSVPPPDGPACHLGLGIEVRKGPAAAARAGGKAIEKSAALLALDEGEERLLDAYSSSLTGGKVALKVRCEPARAAAAALPEMVSLDVEVERRADGEQPEVVGDLRLQAALGREVGTTVADHVTLADGEDGARRYRREQIEITLAPALLVAGKVQFELRVSGEVATVSSEGTTVSHPIERRETYLVGPRDLRTLEIAVSSQGASEGWANLRFQIQVRTRF